MKSTCEKAAKTSTSMLSFVMLMAHFRMLMVVFMCLPVVTRT